RPELDARHRVLRRRAAGGRDEQDAGDERGRGDAEEGESGAIHRLRPHRVNWMSSMASRPVAPNETTIFVIFVRSSPESSAVKARRGTRIDDIIDLRPLGCA